MRSLISLTAVAIAAATLMAAPAGAQTGQSTSTSSVQAQVRNLRQGIKWHREMTWHYQDEAGVRRTPTEHAERHTRSVPFLRWIDQRWSQRHAAAKRLAARARTTIGHEALWLCIHRGEGAWNDDTGNGYYGGLQMSAGWGGVARPDLLSPQAQMALAERGYRASGYSTTWLGHQWPNTSPPCLQYA